MKVAGSIPNSANMLCNWAENLLQMSVRYISMKPLLVHSIYYNIIMTPIRHESVTEKQK